MIYNITELNKKISQLQRELGSCNMLIAIQNQRICDLEGKMACLILENIMGGDDEEVKNLIMSLEEEE